MTLTNIRRSASLRIIQSLAAAALASGFVAAQAVPAEAASKGGAGQTTKKKGCELQNTMGGSNHVPHGESITIEDPDGDGPHLKQTLWCNDGKWDTEKPKDSRYGPSKRPHSGPTKMSRR